MALSLFSSLIARLRSLLSPATPLVPAGPVAIQRPLILECAFVEVPIVTRAADGGRFDATAAAPVAAPGAANEAASQPAAEPDERVVIATIATHAAALVATPRREPEDFLLARRLRSVAMLNRPVRVIDTSRAARPLKRHAAGPLSPIRARSASARGRLAA